MSISWIVNSTAGAFLLPPLNLILLCALGLLLRRRWPRAGMLISATALIVLTLISTRVGALMFITPLERMSVPLQMGQENGAQAIVVLGGGRIANAPEYAGRDMPSGGTLPRLQYAARLQRTTGLPVLVTGGRPDGAVESEAAVMARTLKEDFSVTVKWQEQASNNTAENAQYSARMLKADGIQRILLVTDALHMPRSVRIFTQTGLQVVPAPTIFYSTARWSPDDFLPKAVWLQRAAYAMHEWIGLAWYQLRYRNLSHEQ